MIGGGHTNSQNCAFIRHGGVSNSNLLLEECKLNDGIMNLDYTLRYQDPTADRQSSGDIPSRPKIQWLKSKQKAIWSNFAQELS